MESCLHTVQACTPWQRLKVSEHTGETPFRKWESSWMACLLFLGLSQPQIPPGSLPNFNFCPSFSMVRWLAAAAGPKSLRLWVFLSFIIGWERVDFANQKVSLPPELVTWKPLRENAIPFQNVSISPARATNYQLAKRPPGGPFGSSTMLSWGLLDLEQWATKRILELLILGMVTNVHKWLILSHILSESSFSAHGHPEVILSLS